MGDLVVVELIAIVLKDQIFRVHGFQTPFPYWGRVGDGAKSPKGSLQKQGAFLITTDPMI